MLSRWLFVRIRAAERALEDGRVDEAYAAALQPDVREHRRGQKLLDDLIRPLLARARLHLQAGRLEDALRDLDKLRAIERSGPEVEELRQRVRQELRNQQQTAAAKQQAYNRAADNLAAGRLESGRLEVERVDDARQREDLREQLDVRVRRSDQLLTQAGDSLDRGDVQTALRYWQEACTRHGRSRASDEFVARLGPACRSSLEEWFAAGRLEPLLAMRPALIALGLVEPAVSEFEQIMTLCARAASQLGRRDYTGLRQTLLRLRAARGNIAWLNGLLDALTRMAEAQDTLLASPLGLYASAAGEPAAPSEQDRAESAAETRYAANPPDPHAAPLSALGLLLLVDGAGSSLLVSRDHVRLGRAGGSSEVDVPIPGDIRSHHADIVREGEDYFLIAHGPARVNQREVKRTLLRDGDRITLDNATRTAGRRAPRFVFRKTSTRSGSATLRLSHRCRLSQDVGEVILFHDTCLIGPQSSCHIRTRDGESQLVLFDRSGRLHGREATARGGKLGDAKPIRLGDTLDFGDVRVTVKMYEVSDSA